MFNEFSFDQNKMKLNVQKMDDEHIKLIEIMNQLGRKNDQKADKSELIKILNQLVAFTVEHFSHEEAFFDKIPNYDQASAHKHLHKTLLKRLGDHKEEFEKGKDAQLSNDFFIFLKVWLTAHICGIDTKYGQLVNKKTA